MYSKGEGGGGKRFAGGAGVNSGNCAHLQCTRFCKQHVRVGRRYREEGMGGFNHYSQLAQTGQMGIQSPIFNGIFAISAPSDAVVGPICVP